MIHKMYSHLIRTKKSEPFALGVLATHPPRLTGV